MVSSGGYGGIRPVQTTASIRYPAEGTVAYVRFRLWRAYGTQRRVRWDTSGSDYGEHTVPSGGYGGIRPVQTTVSIWYPAEGTVGYVRFRLRRAYGTQRRVRWDKSGSDYGHHPVYVEYMKDIERRRSLEYI
ncbi:hypothetical protein BV898_17877 [Hypsibius exemplaris]|uniref:Uncharacterized protein n=1 Tax=Hypsibius exemplaris TaxID=2072580 RepID=A0A9X6RML5_HYPEX|nr:hypothetical protein BV898_17877 [Hypsibius exemplaris]